MDQPVAPPETAEDIMDAVTRDNAPRMLERPGKEPVIVMSLPAYWRLQPAPASFEACWADAKAAGLDTMTMDEIDAEIAAARKERREADAQKP